MSNKFRIQVEDDRLRSAEKLFRQLPADLKSRLRKQERSEALPIWKEEIAARRDVTPLASRVFSAGISVNTGAYISLVASGSTKKIGTRRIPLNTLLGAAEFGSSTKSNYTRYYRKTKHGRSIIERRTRAELPDARQRGYVAYPASGKAIERIKSLQIQTTLRQIHDAAEGRS